MSTTAVRTPHGYEDAYEAYYAEAAEEVRSVRVGEKETSEQATIVARHADLFTQEQLDALRAAEIEATDADERERLYRLRSQLAVDDARLAGPASRASSTASWLRARTSSRTSSSRRG
jgi:multidrug resistance efflux pump